MYIHVGCLPPFLFLRIRRPPTSTLTDTPCPCTTSFRSPLLHQRRFLRLHPKLQLVQPRMLVMVMAMIMIVMIVIVVMVVPGHGALPRVGLRSTDPRSDRQPGQRPAGSRRRTQGG